jgi:hypothetical protein
VIGLSSFGPYPNGQAKAKKSGGCRTARKGTGTEPVRTL